MADPTNPNDPNNPFLDLIDGLPGVTTEITEKVKKLGDVVVDATAKANLYNNTQETTKDLFSGLESLVNKAGDALSKLGSDISSDATLFSALSVGLTGATEKFKDLGASVDSNRLGNFSDDMNELITSVTKVSPAGMAASNAVKVLTNTLLGLGVAKSDIDAKMHLGGGALAAMASDFLKNADNALKFQSGLIQVASQTGSMNELYDGVKNGMAGIGENLDNLNKVSAQFSSIMADSIQSTHKSDEELAKYTMSLLATPAGYKAMTDGIDLSGNHLGTLTSVIQTAQGAGMDIAKTFQSINTAVLETGMGYQDAEKYTFRLIDISKDLHAQQSDVAAALSKTSNTFKLYTTTGQDATKMQQGLADTVKSYAQSLQSVGVPAQAALEMASKQTMQMAALSDAQESFISQITGGSGGLKGSFEFEMLREKDPKAAFAKMEQAAKSVAGGKFITKEEAVRTGQEDQYEKQRQILTSGNFGLKAGSQAEADRMSDQIAKGQSFSALSDAQKEKSITDTMAKGEKQEQLAYTGVKEMNITAQIVQLNAMNTNLGTTEKAFSARVGEVSNIGINMKGQERLKAFQKSGELSSDPYGTLSPMERTKKMLSQTTSDIKPEIGGAMTSIHEMITGPEESKNNKSKKPHFPMPGENTYTKNNNTDVHTSNEHTDSSKKPHFPMSTENSYVSAGRQVGAAAHASSSKNETQAERTTGRQGVAASHEANGPIPVTIAGGAITMNLTGACPHCKTPITTNLIGKADNAAANPE